MRIAVLGAGGVGGYLGRRLTQAGEEVVFIARGAHLQAICTGGLRVDNVNGETVANRVFPKIEALSKEPRPRGCQKLRGEQNR